MKTKFKDVPAGANFSVDYVTYIKLDVGDNQRVFIKSKSTRRITMSDLNALTWDYKLVHINPNRIVEYQPNVSTVRSMLDPML